MQPSDSILIVDFGSQVTQLIARRVREAGVYCEIAPFGAAGEVFERLKPKGIIFRRSVVGDVAGQSSRRSISSTSRPILAICYGQQTMAHQLGGVVAASDNREFGRAFIEVVAESALFDGLWQIGENHQVWMSHGDRVEQPARRLLDRRPIGRRAVRHRHRRGAPLLFDDVPSGGGTPRMGKLLANFARHICGCAGDWTMGAYRDAKIADIRAQVGKGKVICGLSGGVDSAVAAVLIHEAIGDQLTCVFVDHGLMRQGEAEQVVSLFRNSYNIPLVHVDAEELFLSGCPASRTRRPSASSSARRSSTCSTRRRRRSAVRTSSLRARSIPT